MKLRNEVLSKLFGAVETTKHNVFPYRSSRQHDFYKNGVKVYQREINLSVAVTFVTETGRESKPFVNFTYGKYAEFTDSDIKEYRYVSNILFLDEDLITNLTKYIVGRRKETGDLKSYVDDYMKRSKRKIHSVYVSHSCGASEVMKIDESVFRKEFLGE
jgi:hypothetical protein